MGQKETETLNHMLLYAAASKALCTVAELGVADHIRHGASRSVSDLAEATRTHQPSLHRVLRFLASYGLFQETSPGQFAHTALSDVLRTDAEGSFRSAAILFQYLFPGWDGMSHTLRSGESGFEHVFGQPVFEFVGAHPELGPIVDAGMTSIHGYETAAMLAAYDLSPIRVLADIGGGNGSLISEVLQRYSKMRGILFDLGHVVERSKENLRRLGLADRCQVIEGSFFETIPPGADAYLFRHIIHDWSEERSVGILSRCRKVIPESGRLLIVECVVPTGNERSISKDFDVTMMTFPGGMERTEAEFRALFEKAGFQLTSVTPTSSMVSVVEGRPMR
jgi:hypothetical protein